MNKQALNGWTTAAPAATEKKPAKKITDWKVDEEYIGFWQQTQLFDSKYGNSASKVAYHLFVTATVVNHEVIVSDEVVSFRGGSGLNNQLDKLTSGILCKITYRGQKKSPKSGMNYHHFDVVTSDNYYTIEKTTSGSTGSSDSEFDDIEWGDD